MRDVAEHHGGTARCVGREGGGTRFDVDLPEAGGDGISAVDLASFSLVFLDGVGLDVTGALALDLTVGAEQATGTMSGFTPGEAYTLILSVADTWGNEATLETDLYAAPAEIVPPVEVEGAGRVHGHAVDSATCDPHLLGCAGLPGVAIRLRADTASGPEVAGTAVSGPGGKFSFPAPATGRYWLTATRDGYTYAQRQVDIVAGRHASAGTLHLTPMVAAALFDDLDGDGAYSPGEDIPAITSAGGLAVAAGAQSDGTPWQIQVTIPPGALGAASALEVLHLTWFEHVELLPSGSLPPGTAETYAFDLSADDATEEVTFLAPVDVTFTNTRGFPQVFPGTDEVMRIPTGYWNRLAGAWEDVGPAVAADPDGDGVADTFTFQTTHFSPWDCNDPTVLPEFDLDSEDETEEESECEDCDHGHSFVTGRGGTLGLSYPLPTARFLGQPIGLELVYDSAHANPSVLLSSSVTLAPTVGSELQSLRWAATLGGRELGPVDFATPEPGTTRFQYLADARDPWGQPLESGLHEAVVQLEAEVESQYYWAQNGVFGAPPDFSLATGLFTTTQRWLGYAEQVAVYDLSTSPLGAGWTLDGWQRLFEGEDGFILVADGQDVARFHAPDKSLLPAVAAPEDTGGGGPRLAVASLDREDVSLFDHALATSLDEVDLQVGDEPNDIVVRPDGAWAYLAVTWDDIVSAVEIATRTPIEIPVGAQPRAVALTPDGQTLYVACAGSGTLGVVSTLTHTEIEQIPTGAGAWDVALTADGAAVVVPNRGAGTVTTLKPGTPAEPSHVEVAPFPTRVTLSPDGLRAYVLHRPDSTAQAGTVSVLDLEAQSVLAELEVGMGVESIVVSGDGGSVFVSNRFDHDVDVIDTASLSLAPPIATALQPAGLTLSPDGALLYLAHSLYGRITTIDVATRSVVNDLPLAGSAWSSAVSSDGARLFVAKNQGNHGLDVVELATGEILPVGVTGKPTLVALTPDDGEALVVSPATDRLSFASVAAVDQTVRVPSPGEQPTRAAFSPDGTWLFFADEEAKELVFVDTAAAEIAASIKLYAKASALAVAPDGLTLFVALPDKGSIAVFDVATQSLETSIPLEGGSPGRLLMHPDGATLYVTLGTTNAVGLVATETRTLEQTIPLGGPPGPIVRHPVSGHLFVAQPTSKSVAVVDPAADAPIGDIPIGAFVYDMAVTPDGGHVYAVMGSGLVGVLSVDTFEKILELTVGDNPVALAGVAGRMLVASSVSGTVSIVDPLTHTVITEVPTAAGANAVLAHPTGPWAYVLHGTSNLLMVLDVETADILGTMRTGGSPFALAVQGGGGAATTAGVTSLTSWDTSSLAWDEEAGAYLRSYPDGRIVRFHPDGTHASTTYREGHEVRYGYGDEGRLVEVTAWLAGADAPALTWSLSYSGGALDAVTSPSGAVTDVTVDAHGDLVALTAPDGAARTFGYDGEHRATTKAVETGEVTTYTYDPYGRVAAVAGPEQIVAVDGVVGVDQEVRHYAPADTQGLINDVDAPLVGTPDAPATAVSDEEIVSVVGPPEAPRVKRHDAAGLLSEEIDSLGRSTTWLESDDGLIRQRTSPSGRCVRTGLDSLGAVLSETRLPPAQCALPFDEQDLAQGLTTSVTYEPRFHQVKTSTDADGYTTTFVYDYELEFEGDGVGHLRQVMYPTVETLDPATGELVPAAPAEGTTWDEHGQMATETDAAGAVTRYHYTDDARGLLAAVVIDEGGLELTTTFAGFDEAGQPTTVTDPLGRATTYEYDPQTGHHTAEIREVDLDGDGDPETPRTELAYDALGRLVEQIEDADGAQARATTWDHDARGLLTATTLTDLGAGESLTTSRYYDARRRLTMTVDGAGDRTVHRYDSEGQRTERIVGWTGDQPEGLAWEAFSWTIDGQLETVTTSAGLVTTFTYDDVGRRVRRTEQAASPDAGPPAVTELAYDGRGNVTARTTPDGTVTTYAYDGMGRLIELVRDASGEALTTQLSYDLAGRLLRRVDPGGGETHFAWDAAGRLVERVDDATGLALVTTLAWDAAGNQVARTDWRGVVTEMSYDALDRPVAITLDAVTAGDEAALGLTMSYRYDRLGRRVHIARPDGRVETPTWDAFDRPVANVLDPDGLAIDSSMTWDGAHRLLTLTDAHGQTTSWTYDALGRATATTWPDGSQQTVTYQDNGTGQTIVTPAEVTLDLELDAWGRVVEIASPGGDAQTFAYDAMGRLAVAVDTASGAEVTRTWDALGDLASEVQTLDGDPRTVSWSRDRAARTVTVTYPHGGALIRTEDPLGRLTEVREAGGAVVASWSHDDVGGTVTRTAGNGVTTTTGRDDAGRVTSVVTSVGDSGYTYLYTEDGRLGSVSRAYRPEGARFDVYGYDGAARLTSVAWAADAGTPDALTASAGETTYTLDALGNRVAVVAPDGVTTLYEPSAEGELTDPMNRYLTVGDLPLSYDAHGNLTAGPLGARTWDAANRMTSYTAPDGTVTTYRYDALGRRVEKVVGGVATRNLYDGVQIIEERDGAGALTRTYAFGDGIDDVVRVVDHPSGSASFLHRDGLGSVTERTDAAGLLAEAYEYDVYGAPTIYTDAERTVTVAWQDSGRTPYLFTARRFDAESGDYHLRTRSYSPALGRFVSNDPLGYEDGLNRYAYAQSDPVSRRDPLGTASTTGTWLVPPLPLKAVPNITEWDVEVHQAMIPAPPGPPLIIPIPKLRLTGVVDVFVSGWLECHDCDDRGQLTVKRFFKLYPLPVPFTFSFPIKNILNPFAFMGWKGGWKIAITAFLLSHKAGPLAERATEAVTPAIDQLIESADIICEGIFDPLSLLSHIQELRQDFTIGLPDDLGPQAPPRPPPGWPGPPDDYHL